MSSIPLEKVSANLNDISWDILQMLAKKENMNYNEIRAKLKLSLEKCYKEIARLEGAVLIETKKDSRDQRLLLFNLTEYGLEILKLK